MSFLHARGCHDLEALIRGRDYRRSQVKPKVRIEQIQPETPECPGIVWYGVDLGQGESSGSIQPFRRAGGPDGGHRLVWSAEGPDDALTLNPSFLCTIHHHMPDGSDVEVRVHLFLRDGKIELCGDSTVELAEGASPAA